MKTALAKDKLSLILKTGTTSAGGDQSPLSGHLILNRCLIDDDGNICVTAPVDLLGILDLIDALKSELDTLGNEAVLWFAQTVALRRARLKIIANDHDESAAVDSIAGGNRVSVGNPLPLQFWALSNFTKHSD